MPIFLLTKKLTWLVIITSTLFFYNHGMDTTPKELSIPWRELIKKRLCPSALYLQYETYATYVQNGPCLMVSVIDEGDHDCSVTHYPLIPGNHNSLNEIFTKEKIKIDERKRNSIYFFGLPSPSPTENIIITPCHSFGTLLQNKNKSSLVEWLVDVSEWQAYDFICKLIDCKQSERRSHHNNTNPLVYKKIKPLTIECKNRLKQDYISETMENYPELATVLSIKPTTIDSEQVFETSEQPEKSLFYLLDHNLLPEIHNVKGNKKRTFDTIIDSIGPN